jgi:ABC-type dipeptide/oligopeptide/nickel transport system ATPase component
MSEPSTQPLLEVEDLAIEFDTMQLDGTEVRRRVVDGISFTLGKGEVLGILGESGSGKTISTMAVLGLVQGRPGVVGGRITLYDGDRPVQVLEGLESTLKRRKGQPVQKDLRRWEKRRLRTMRPLWGRVVTAVFQNPRLSLDPLMTVGAQVEESVNLADAGLQAEQVRERALAWLDRVQLNDPLRVHKSYPHELSGGMCQRAMIAVAMARKPRLLIADEPTTGLDMTVRAEIIELFKDLLADRERSMVYISHDVREVLHLSDRVLVMRHGRVLETSTAQDLLKGRGQRDAYTRLLLSAADLDPGVAA